MINDRYTPPPEAAESAVIIRDWYKSLNPADRAALDAIAGELVEQIRSINPGARISLQGAVEVVVKTYFFIGG